MFVVCLCVVVVVVVVVVCVYIQNRAVAVECCYQNTGIATSVAAAMFNGAELSTAVGVPLFYGMCEAFFLAVYCLICWKAGWTKAPTDENVCKVILTSYEVKQLMDRDPEAIEVVLGLPDKEGGHNDMIFATTQEGYQIDEVSLGSLNQTDDSSSPENAARKMSEDFPIEDLDEGEEADGSRRPSYGKRYSVVETSSPTKDDQSNPKDPPIPAEGKQID